MTEHDPLCPPGLGKPEPSKCAECLKAGRIREDERRRIAEANKPVDPSHDPLCPLVKGCSCPWYPGPCENCDCICDLIKQIREHERSLHIEDGREGMNW